MFVLKILTLGGNVIYSSHSMNNAYDPNFVGGANQIFSSAYDGTDPTLAGVPAGTFVGFEGEPTSHSDFDYNDETFVFTNVAAAAHPPTPGPPAPTPPGAAPTPPIPTPLFTPGAVPEPATWAMMLLGFGLMGASLRGARRRRAPDDQTAI